MHPRRVGQNTVEIEEEGSDAVWETQHRRAGYFKRNARMRSSYCAVSRA